MHFYAVSAAEAAGTRLGVQTDMLPAERTVSIVPASSNFLINLCAKEPLIL